MKNNRGEVTTLIVIGVAVVSLIIGGLIPNPVKFFQRQSEPGTESRTYDTKDIIITPFVSIDDNGKTTVANKVEEHYAKGNDKRTLKQTLGQRLAGFIASLGTWGIVLLFGGLALGIITPAGIFARSRHVMKSAFKNTVNGIRGIKDTTVTCRKCGDTVTIDTYAHVSKALAEEQDKRDKVLIDKIKAELH